MPTYLGRIDGEIGQGNLYSDGCNLILEGDYGDKRRIDLSQADNNSTPAEEFQPFVETTPGEEQVNSQEFSQEEEEVPINLEYGEYASRLALTIIPVVDIPTQFIMPDAIRRVISLAEKYPQLKIASYDNDKIYFIDDPISYPNYYEDYLLEIADVINSDYELPFIVAISVTPISEENFQTYYSLTSTESSQADTVPIDEQDSITRGFVPEGYVAPPPIIPPWEENPDDYYKQNGVYRLKTDVDIIERNCADGTTQVFSEDDFIWDGDSWILRNPCWDHIGDQDEMNAEEGRISYLEYLAKYGETY
jgi:hypothetical protein